MEKTLSKDEILEKTKKYIEEHLLPIVHSVDESLEGNLFFHHGTTNICIDFLKIIAPLLIFIALIN